MAPRKGIIHDERVSCLTPEANLSIYFLGKAPRKKTVGPVQPPQSEPASMAGSGIGTRRSSRLQSFAVEVPSRASNSSLSSPSLFSRGESAQSNTDGYNTPATTVNPTPTESDSIPSGRPKRISAAARAMELRNSSFALGSSRKRTAKELTVVEDSQSEGSDARLALTLQAEEYGEEADSKRRKLSEPIVKKKRVIKNSTDEDDGEDLNDLIRNVGKGCERAITDLFGTAPLNQPNREERSAYSPLNDSDSALSDLDYDLYNYDMHVGVTSDDDDEALEHRFVDEEDDFGAIYNAPARRPNPIRSIRRRRRLTRVSNAMSPFVTTKLIKCRQKKSARSSRISMQVLRQCGKIYKRFRSSRLHQRHNLRESLVSLNLSNWKD